VLEQIWRIHREDDVCNEAFLSDALLVADRSAFPDRVMRLCTELADEVVLNGKLC
jgi:hypothetical protein